MLTHAAATGRVLVLRFVDAIAAQDIDVMIRSLDGMLARHDRIGVAVDVDELADLRGHHVASGHLYGVSILARLNRVRRLAVVVNADWPEAAVSRIRSLCPHLELRQFATRQRPEAIGWAGAFDAPPPEPAPAVRRIRAADGDGVAFEVEGSVISSVIPLVIGQLERAVAHHATVRVLARISRLTGFNPTVLARTALPMTRRADLRQITRCAVVGAPAWLETTVRTPAAEDGRTEVRAFPLAQEAAAWAWLGSRHVT